MALQAIDDLNLFVTKPDKASQSSYSALTLHRKCPQAWSYRHLMGLEKDIDAPRPYLTVGIWWSLVRAAESLTRGRAAESLVFLPEHMRDRREGYDFDIDTVTVPEVLRAAQTRWKGMNGDEQDAFTDALGERLPERLERMFSIWDKAHGDRFDRERPLGVEVFWKRTLPRPSKDEAWLNVEGIPPMNLIGFIDELYVDRLRNMTVVRDHKAQKDISSGNSALDDLMDSQLQLYAWGIEPQLKAKDLPPARAVAYDRTKSVAPREPQLTASGGLSKSVTAYDLDTYRRWAQEDTRPTEEELEEIIAEKQLTNDQVAEIAKLPAGRVWGKIGEFYATGAKKGQPKFGIYEMDPKVIENLASHMERAKWTSRTLTPVNRNMLQTHLRAAVDTAYDIFQTQKRVEETGAAARNLDRRGCSFCDFAPLCQAQIVGGPRGEYDIESYGLRIREGARPVEAP